MYKILSTLILTALCFTVSAQEPATQDILDRFAKTLSVPNIQGILNAQLISAKGDVREIQARAYQKLIGSAQNNRLFVFNHPPTVRGTSLLVHSFFDGRPNNMWIYLPAVRRVRRIALESSGGGYFMGSDFTYRDLINTDNSKMVFERLPDAVKQGQDSWVIKAQGETVQVQQEHGYQFIISYYRKDNYLLHVREYYDFNGELIKVYTVEDFLAFGSWIYPTKTVMRNVQTGHQSHLVVTDISTDTIPDSHFTTRYMQEN